MAEGFPGQSNNDLQESRKNDELMISMQVEDQSLSQPKPVAKKESDSDKDESWKRIRRAFSHKRKEMFVTDAYTLLQSRDGGNANGNSSPYSIINSTNDNPHHHDQQHLLHDGELIMEVMVVRQQKKRSKWYYKCKDREREKGRREREIGRREFIHTCDQVDMHQARSSTFSALIMNQRLQSFVPCTLR
eukprot:TRINITY_DN11414_c0_g1_i14.p1 TRINITY_DN11414_c0_g1~~TRINITY_DN11414_c0_g1_i14.p1  ORF type:complete len:189 (+),score=0.59 TRINITY_DN11414_c0_g1_i14:180-746(+)